MQQEITKREVVVNGASNVFKRTITASDVVPFFNITLPDPDVLEIDSVILLEGTNFTTNPTNAEFNNAQYKYFEVDYLAQQRIFTENFSSSAPSTQSVKAGRWLDVTRKFIKEFTPNGYCKLTFGSGDSDVDAFKEGFLKEGVSNQYFLQNFLTNTALGEKLKANYTLFVRYRTGGGVSSNVGARVITQLGTYNLTVHGSRQDYNQQVQRSLSVTNPIPAIGGNDGLSVEQIRQLIKYNFSGQYRDVTLTDYLTQVFKMPGKFGSPFRANVFKENNKIVVAILALDETGKLSNTSTSLLKENIAEYLSQFRMVNDYVEARDGRIFNIAIDVDVYVEERNDSQIANNIISTVTDFFSINNKQMNEDIFLAPLQNSINDIDGW